MKYFKQLFSHDKPCLMFYNLLSYEFIFMPAFNEFRKFYFAVS